MTKNIQPIEEVVAELKQSDSYQKSKDGFEVGGQYAPHDRCSRRGQKHTRLLENTMTNKIQSVEEVVNALYANIVAIRATTYSQETEDEKIKLRITQALKTRDQAWEERVGERVGEAVAAERERIAKAIPERFVSFSELMRWVDAENQKAVGLIRKALTPTSNTKE